MAIKHHLWHLGEFFLRFIDCWVLLRQNSNLVVAIFSSSLFSVRHFLLKIGIFFTPINWSHCEGLSPLRWLLSQRYLLHWPQSGLEAGPLPRQPLGLRIGHLEQNLTKLHRCLVACPAFTRVWGARTIVLSRAAICHIWLKCKVEQGCAPS